MRAPGGQIPDDLEGAYDFGLGAGFYLNATEAPFAAHYHMAHYVEEELPLVLEAFPELDHTREAISGHSMGGHGALTIALRNPRGFALSLPSRRSAPPPRCPGVRRPFVGISERIVVPGRATTPVRCSRKRLPRRPCAWTKALRYLSRDPAAA